MSGYIYLASPYSHESRAVRKLRYNAVCKKAAELKMASLIVYSPIAHWAPIEDMFPEVGRSHAEHRDTNECLIRCAERVMVLMLEGWQQSIGVEAEVVYAQRIGKPIEYIDP